MSTPPSNWIKHVESLVVQSKDVPMWGAVPSFPWKEFMKEFASSLNVSKLKLSSGTAEWKKGATTLSGLGRSPLQLAIEFSPLQGNFSLVFPSEDFSKLSSWVINPKAGNEGFSDPYLQKGFFRYLSLEAMMVMDRMQIYQGLTPKLIEKPLETEDAYCIDIAIQRGEETIWGRIICPTLFQESFKKHFSGDWNFSLPSHLYEELLLDLNLSVGETKLSQDSWKKLEEGDLLLLDFCSYYPNLKKGTFQLQFDNTPLFQVKPKEESIKILDYAHYFEENKMSDEDFEEPFDESIEETPLEETPMESVSVEEPPQQKISSPKKIPISLTVEVARIRMNLDKLLKLKPGNVLELGVHPEKGVNLVANGKCVGKGELIQVGDVIGVKITKLGE